MYSHLLVQRLRAHIALTTLICLLVGGIGAPLLHDVQEAGHVAEAHTPGQHDCLLCTIVVAIEPEHVSLGTPPALWEASQNVTGTFTLLPLRATVPARAPPAVS